MNQNSFSIETLRQNPHDCLSPASDDVAVFFEPYVPFSLENMKKTLPSSDYLGTLSQILNILSFAAPGRAQKITLFRKDYSEQTNPYHDVSFRFMSQWLFDDYNHFSRQGTQLSPFLEDMLKEMTEWIDCFAFWQDREQLTRHTQLMVWNDAATGVRLIFFTYVLLRLINNGDGRRIAVCERIFRAAIDHYLLLVSDAFYNPRTNHGFFQNMGLLCFCLAFPHVTKARQAIELTEQRILIMLDERLSDEGFLKEHSLFYQAFFLFCHINLLNVQALSPQATVRIQHYVQKMADSLRLFLLPDGTEARLGDSPKDSLLPELQTYLENMPEPEKAPITIYPSAGYGFLHSETTQSHVILAASFHSRVHKHCDDLHVLWSEGAENLLADSGMFGLLGKILPDDPRFAKGFWYSDPRRIYTESVHAHNAVEINGESYSRKIKPYGALPMTGRQVSGTCLCLESRWKRPEGYMQSRVLVLQPGQWLLVLDSLEPAKKSIKSAKFSQWFHLGQLAQPVPAEQIEKQAGESAHRFAFAFPSCTLWCQPLLNSVSSSTHYGETEPRLQGWLAENSDILVPAWAIGYHMEGHTAQFGTLFTLNKTLTHFAPVHAKSGMVIFELRFSDGTTDSFLI